jgi:membrane protease YdiL (CAAX protease family)
MGLSANLSGLTAASSILLLFAVPGIWIHRWVAVCGLALAVFFAALAGHVTPFGVVTLAGFAGLASLYRQSNNWLVWVALVIGSGLFYLHSVQGISGWLLLGPVQIGQGAEYEKWLSVDKVGAGVLLLALALPGIYDHSGWRAMFVRCWPWMLSIPAVLAALATLSGVVHPDVTPVAFFWPWAVVNLLGVCVVEEVLFRGLIQTRLLATCRKHAAPEWVGLIASAVIFGLAHAQGGAALVGFAALAGVGYGICYHLSNRIEAAILTHFALNAVHFLFLTYPFPA